MVMRWWTVDGRAALAAVAALSVLASTAAQAAGSGSAASGAGTQAGAAASDDAGRLKVTVGAGAVLQPDYVGSDDFEVAPFPVLMIEKDDLFLETDGPGVRANVMPGGRFLFGPVVRYGEGREDVEDDAVGRLPEIDDSFWLGAFAGVQFLQILHPYDRLRFEVEGMQATDSGDGRTATLKTEYATALSRQASLRATLSTTYADGDYADTYFSISPSGAAASGLSRFDAASGMRDVSLKLIGKYELTDRIGLGAVAGVSKLLGDFADSPVVSDRGTDTPVYGGLFVTYGF